MELASERDCCVLVLMASKRDLILQAPRGEDRRTLYDEISKITTHPGVAGKLLFLELNDKIPVRADQSTPSNWDALRADLNALWDQDNKSGVVLMLMTPRGDSFPQFSRDQAVPPQEPGEDRDFIARQFNADYFAPNLAKTLDDQAHWVALGERVGELLERFSQDVRDDLRRAHLAAALSFALETHPKSFRWRFRKALASVEHWESSGNARLAQLAHEYCQQANIKDETSESIEQVLESQSSDQPD